MFKISSAFFSVFPGKVLWDFCHFKFLRLQHNTVSRVERAWARPIYQCFQLHNVWNDMGRWTRLMSRWTFATRLSWLVEYHSCTHLKIMSRNSWNLNEDIQYRSRNSNHILRGCKCRALSLSVLLITFVECLRGSKSCSLSFYHLIRVIYATSKGRSAVFGKTDYLNFRVVWPCIFLMK